MLPLDFECAWLRRLNRLGDVGCSAICSALSDNTILERLSLSANGAGPQVPHNLLSPTPPLKNHLMSEHNEALLMTHSTALAVQFAASIMRSFE